MIRVVFFGCRIIILVEKHKKQLIKIYESPIVKKLGLSEKFPHLLLYIRKSTLGIRIIKLRTIIAIVLLRLYVTCK